MYTIHEQTWDFVESTIIPQYPHVPIEQTRAWASYQQTIEGRTPWGVLSIARDGVVAAYVSLFDYQTHGYHYLRSHHGPVWVEQPSEQEEREALEALRDFVRAKDKRQLFVRLSVDADLDICQPVLSGIPYDTTVFVDVTGGDEEILSRMKTRGRRDVRKSLREAPVTCADETEQALESFREYYAVMEDTAQRDGFTPAPISDYEQMLACLGKEHSRVFAARLEETGAVCAWSLYTISGTLATRYYAASATEVMRLHVADRLCYFELCEVGRNGIVDVDLMAVGSDFCPQLKGLNGFKCKFAKETVRVAPDRDLPVRAGAYGLLVTAKSLRSKLRGE